MLGIGKSFLSQGTNSPKTSPSISRCWQDSYTVRLFPVQLRRSCCPCNTRCKHKGTLLFAIWASISELQNCWGLWYMYIFYLKENLCTSLAQQESEQTEFLSASYCHCSVTPSITSDRSITPCQRENRAPGERVCLSVSPSMFPGLSGSSLGGCATNSYKASIMEGKVAASDSDDIQKVRHLAEQAQGSFLFLSTIRSLSISAMESPKNMAEDKRLEEELSPLAVLAVKSTSVSGHI